MEDTVQELGRKLESIEEENRCILQVLWNFTLILMSICNCQDLRNAELKKSDIYSSQDAELAWKMELDSGIHTLQSKVSKHGNVLQRLCEKVIHGFEEIDNA